MAMLGSITVLPAMLSKVGDGVDRGRIPFLGKRMQRRTESRVWSAILRPVMRRPLVAAVLATGLLVALAIPALGMHTASSGIEQLPQTPIMKTLSKMQKAFPGGEAPEQVVIAAKDVTTPEVKGAIADLKARAAHTDGINSGISVEYSQNHRVAVVELPIEGKGNDAKSYAALENIREDLVPATVGKLKGAEVVVGGNAAQSKDYNDLVKGSAPIVFAFVLTLAFLLLMVTFRSIVVPIKAIILNLLSVGASYGVLTLVFQHGWLHKQLGFETPGFVVAWLPLFLFVILFGLSMDYHVYILSRVREAFDKGMTTEDAVEHGIKQTAGTVTSAAFVMVGVFAIFGTLSIIDFKMLGIGLAVAIFIDATLVRAVLLPATMKLLGDRNWYLPSKLGWLPKLEHEGEVGARRAAKPLPSTPDHDGPPIWRAVVRSGEPVRAQLRQRRVGLAERREAQRLQHLRRLQELDLVVLHDLHAIAERIAEVEPGPRQQVDPLGGEHASRALLVVDDEPEVPILAGAGREQRDELIAEVEERAAVRALHAPELEQPAVERDARGRHRRPRARRG